MAQPQVYHAKTQTVGDSTATSLIRPSDHNSVHVIVGGHLEAFEPFHLLNPASTTWLPGLGTWYFQPFVAPQALSSGHLAQLWSYTGTSNGVVQGSNGASWASNTTGTATHSQSVVHSIALYSIGTGGNSTRLETFWSNSWGINLARSVSVILTNATNVRVTFGATLTYIASVGSDGAYTTSSITGSGSQSSAAASMATSALSSVVSSIMNVLSGQIRIPFGFNTTIPPGQYWLGVGYSTSTSTAGSTLGDGWAPVNKAGLYGISSMPYRRFGLTVSNTSQQLWVPAGRYSAASAVPPGTVQSTQVRSIASHVTDYFAHAAFALTA